MFATIKCKGCGLTTLVFEASLRSFDSTNKLETFSDFFLACARRFKRNRPWTYILNLYKLPYSKDAVFYIVSQTKCKCFYGLQPYMVKFVLQSFNIPEKTPRPVYLCKQFRYKFVKAKTVIRALQVLFQSTQYFKDREHHKLAMQPIFQIIPFLPGGSGFLQAQHEWNMLVSLEANNVDTAVIN